MVHYSLVPHPQFAINLHSFLFPTSVVHLCSTKLVLLKYKKENCTINSVKKAECPRQRENSITFFIVCQNLIS